MITIDFETKSYADLPKVGAWAYSEDPTTEVICLSYGIDDQPVQSWWPGKRLIPGTPQNPGAGELLENAMPWDLYMALQKGDPIEAFNVAFEKSVWMNVLGKPPFMWYVPRENTWRDIQAVACYYALPAKLEKLALTLGFGGKDPEGGRLITKYSKLHLKTAKKKIPPEDFKKFVKYCERDVLVEQAVSDYLGDLPEKELEVFLLDQIINLRGLYLDQDGIDAATVIVDQRSEELTKEFRSIVGLNPTQREKVSTWCAKQGVVLDNMQKDYLQELLDGDGLPQGDVRRALEIRLLINKASTKKLDAMSRQRGKDGRAHFQTRYHGAGTGRWTGSGFQPLNLNRGFEDVPPEQLVRDIMYRDAKWLDAIYGSAMDAVGKASRHWIQAQEGNKIMAGDYSSIEAILLSCLAGEEWKVKAFKDKVKIYELMGDKIHKLPPGTVTKKTHPMERKDGKTGELAFGYQGALGAWLNFDSSGRHSDERIIEMCKMWRQEHPMIVKFWRELEHEAIQATRKPGTERGYRDIGFEIVDDWLSMILPNGKRIWYFKPELRATMPQWHQPATKVDCRTGNCDCKARPQLTYMASKTGQWQRVNTYGGKLAENATQATSREVLVPGMLRAEKYKYSIILSVYDEIVSEVPKDFGSVEEFSEIMCQSPGRWADNYPLSVDAWEGDRYKK